MRQAEKSLEYIHAVSGTGFDVSPDIGKVFRIINTQELTGNLVLAFHETESAFAQVVGNGDGEIPDPFRVVIQVFSEPDQNGVFFSTVIRIEILEIGSSYCSQFFKGEIKGTAGGNQPRAVKSS